MTSVVVWRDREDFGFGDGPGSMILQDVRIAADSLISNPGRTGGQQILTGAAAKIIPIPIKLFAGYESGPGYHPVYDGQIGFAYAGSTFAATMTHALAASCLTTLCGDVDAPLPAMADLARFIGRIGSRYITDSAARFEACLVGADCDRRGLSDTRCFHLSYSDADRAMTVTEIDLDPPGAFLLLGDRKDEVGALIRAGFEGDPTFQPSRAIAQIIADAGIAEIGGALQLASARRGGFRLLPTWGYSAATQSFPGLIGLNDEEGLGGVGSYSIGDP